MNSINRALLWGMILAGGLPAAYAETQNVNVSSSITVITPISINVNNNIDFGRFAPGSMSSTITVASTGIRSVTSGDADLAAGGTISPLSFTITGSAGYAVSLTYNPAVGNTVDLVNGFNTLPLSLISPPSSCTLNGSGQCSITIGTSVTVGPATMMGPYSGTVTIYAQYT
ncbi:MAG: hypothetical protein K0R66_93 [Gammaproteobacteria bacterium]|jgi:hypothetical protein|nr:hypothetical protein [Gammaproteobacteria bacterium]